MVQGLIGPMPWIKCVVSTAGNVGYNNNMGVDVSCREIKKLCHCMASLGQFIGCLCHFIKKALGEEHMQRLDDAGNSNFFTRYPVPTKELWDEVQDVGPKTFSFCIVVEHPQKSRPMAAAIPQYSATC